MKPEFLIPLKFSDDSIITDYYDINSRTINNVDNIEKFLENGELEKIIHNIADIITSMKQNGSTNREILNVFSEITGFKLKEEKNLLQTNQIPVEDIKKEIDRTTRKMDSLKSLLLSEDPSVSFSRSEWRLEENITINSAKTILGDNPTFHIDTITIDINPGEAVIFEKIIFKKIAKEGTIRIIKGNVFFEDISFDGIKIELHGNSNLYIKNSKFSHINTAIYGKNNSVIKMENISFDKTNDKIILLTDMADIKNLNDVINTYPQIKEGLLGSHVIAVKLLKEGIINFPKALSSVKNLKISGEFEITDLIQLTGDNFSIEGEDELILTSKLKYGFLLKNNSLLKCKNVTFKCNFEDIQIEKEAEDIEHEEEEKKESGFIHLKNSAIELSECKLTGSYSGIQLEEHSRADIKGCNIVNNIKSGVGIKSSKAKITACNFEANGEKLKHYPQIGILNNSDVEIRNTNICNAINSDGIYICSSKALINKCNINNNNNGLDIRDSSEVKVAECNIKSNREEGIYIYYNSKAVIKKCNIINNKSNGFDIRDISEVEIYDSLIKGNIRGIDIKSSKLKAADCKINENVKGIYIEINSAADIQSCTINKSKMNGIYIDSSRIRITDCEIDGNCEKGEENFQIYAGKKSKVDIKNTVITNSGDKYNDIFAEFESSKIITEDCKIDGEIKYGHKKDGCFITTATCMYLDKNDNCYELNMFRTFRDKWLRYENDGEGLIKEYYSIGPSIVSKIDSSPDNEIIYEKIWNNYLSKCLTLIEHKNFKEAKELYINMVNTLKRFESLEFNVEGCQTLKLKT